MIFCTPTTEAFLPRAKVLARSVKEHHPDSLFILGYLERELHSKAALYPYFDKIVLAKDWGHPHFERLVFQHPVYHAQCALRPAFLKYVLNAYPDEKIVCLGADTKLYSPLRELEAALDHYPMVLSNHKVEPNKEENYLYFGMYNGEMIGFRNVEVAHRYCNWMGERMMHYCYEDYQTLFYDQTWLKFTPIYFNSHGLMHPGYNIAVWNIDEHSRQLRIAKDGSYQLINGDGLRFFHFSQLSLLKYRLDRMSNPVLNRLLAEYLQELSEADHADGISWSYDFFESGEQISSDTRQAYGKSDYLRSVFPHPFQSSNDVMNRALIASQTQQRKTKHKPNRKIKRSIRRIAAVKPIKRKSK
jgi:hypothetical protein